jgi:hypothetical protein
MWLFDRSHGSGQASDKESASVKNVLSMSKYLLSFAPRTTTRRGSKTSSTSSQSAHRISKSSIRPSADVMKKNNEQAASSTCGHAEGKLCCDKCDGKHLTEDCPHYKKKREAHPDAQKSFYKKLGGSSTLPYATLARATVMRQPGDGSCLFHSISYGLGSRYNARSIRQEICAFIKSNPEFRVRIEASIHCCELIVWLNRSAKLL